MRARASASSSVSRASIRSAGNGLDAGQVAVAVLDERDPEPHRCPGDRVPRDGRDEAPRSRRSPAGGTCPRRAACRGRSRASSSGRSRRGPAKPVWGLTRLTGTMRSAPSKALRSTNTGTPGTTSPRSTVSIEERISQPIAAGVIPIAGQDRELALGGRAAVAAHRRDDEHVRARLPEALHHGAHDFVDAVDAAAAGGDAGARARPDRADDVVQRQARPPPGHRRSPPCPGAGGRAPSGGGRTEGTRGRRCGSCVDHASPRRHPCAARAGASTRTSTGRAAAQTTPRRDVALGGHHIMRSVERGELQARPNDDPS